MEGGEGREERKQFFKIVGFAGKRFLHSPPPPPSFLFLLSFQFSRRTRAEPLATQATYHSRRISVSAHVQFGVGVSVLYLLFH